MILINEVALNKKNVSTISNTLILMEIRATFFGKIFCTFYHGWRLPRLNSNLLHRPSGHGLCQFPNCRLKIDVIDSCIFPLHCSNQTYSRNLPRHWGTERIECYHCPARHRSRQHATYPCPSHGHGSHATAQALRPQSQGLYYGSMSATITNYTETLVAVVLVGWTMEL